MHGGRPVLAEPSREEGSRENKQKLTNLQSQTLSPTRGQNSESSAGSLWGGSQLCGGAGGEPGGHLGSPILSPHTCRALPPSRPGDSAAALHHSPYTMRCSLPILPLHETAFLSIAWELKKKPKPKHKNISGWFELKWYELTR